MAPEKTVLRMALMIPIVPGTNLAVLHCGEQALSMAMGRGNKLELVVGNLMLVRRKAIRLAVGKRKANTGVEEDNDKEKDTATDMAMACTMACASALGVWRY